MTNIVTANKFWIIKPNRLNYQLSYMSIIDKDHSKRAQTGMNWACVDSKDWKECGEVFDNVPTSGIEFISYHGRYSTDNKVMRVQDPRGFQVEIYIDNLMDIIKNVTIKNGVIKEPLTWGRRSGKIYLMHPKNESVTINNYTETKKLDIGDHFTSPAGEYIYLGKKKVKIKADLYIVDLINFIDYRHMSKNININLKFVKEHCERVDSKESTVSKHFSLSYKYHDQLTFSESSRVIVKEKNVKLPDSNYSKTLDQEVKYIAQKLSLKNTGIHPKYPYQSICDNKENNDAILSYFYSSYNTRFNLNTNSTKRFAVIYTYEVID